jgi:hypothetical protein
MAIAEVGGGTQRATKLGTAGDTTLAFPANVTSGNLLICVGAAFDSSGSTIGVTDTRSTVYSVLSAVPFTGGRLWIAYGIALSSGACTVTANVTPDTAGQSFSIDEFSGVNATPLDVDGGQTTATSTAVSDTLTTLTANDLLIGAACYDTATTTLVEGATYTLIGKEPSNAIQSHLAELRLVGAAQLYTVTATIGASQPNSMYTAGFKESTGGAGTHRLSALGVGT